MNNFSLSFPTPFSSCYFASLVSTLSSPTPYCHEASRGQTTFSPFAHRRCICISHPSSHLFSPPIALRSPLRWKMYVHVVNIFLAASSRAVPGSSVKVITYKLKLFRKALRKWQGNLSRIDTLIANSNKIILMIDEFEEERSLHITEWNFRKNHQGQIQSPHGLQKGYMEK